MSANLKLITVLIKIGHLMQTACRTVTWYLVLSWPESGQLGLPTAAELLHRERTAGMMDSISVVKRSSSLATPLLLNGFLNCNLWIAPLVLVM